MSLAPYSGPWNIEVAKHLLSRTCIGYTKAELDESQALGLDGSLDRLLRSIDLGDGPVMLERGDAIEVGETWYDKPYDLEAENVNRQVARRRRSLAIWTEKLLLESSMSAFMRMHLFNQNHFVTADIRDARFIYHNFLTFGEEVFGNLRRLTEKMTIEPSMLRYLNGNRNRDEEPNENYARELFELFTIGRGEQIAEGDYSTYTESDVSAAARVLTGWLDTGYIAGEEGLLPGARFVTRRHDESPKQFSSYFGDQLIEDAGEEEYKLLIDMIFRQEATAHNLCRDLYRWFVNWEITSDIEEEVISPMAQILYDNDYEVLPVLQVLFRSEHFYDISIRGGMIKSPIDLVVGSLKHLDVDLPEEQVDQLMLFLYGTHSDLGMELNGAPSVAGWPAYYQEPGYYQNWISTNTLSARQDLVNTFMDFNQVEVDPETGNPVGASFPLIGLISRFDNPGVLYDLIKDLVTYLLPYPLSEEQIRNMEARTLNGLPDYEWTIEYNRMIGAPDNLQLKQSMRTKLVGLFSDLFSLPDYQLH